MEKFFRTPWITYGIVYMYRRKLGFYMYDLEAFEDYWTDSPLAHPPVVQHGLSAGTAAFLILPMLAVQVVYAWQDTSASEEFWLFTYLFNLSMVILMYHLFWVIFAVCSPKSQKHSFWRWTLSFPSELVVIAITALASVQI